MPICSSRPVAFSYWVYTSLDDAAAPAWVQHLVASGRLRDMDPDGSHVAKMYNYGTIHGMLRVGDYLVLRADGDCACYVPASFWEWFSIGESSSSRVMGATSSLREILMAPTTGRSPDEAAEALMPVVETYEAELRELRDALAIEKAHVAAFNARGPAVMRLLGAAERVIWADDASRAVAVCALDAAIVEFKRALS